MIGHASKLGLCSEKMNTNFTAYSRTILINFGSNWLSFLGVVKENVKVKIPIDPVLDYVGPWWP